MRWCFMNQCSQRCAGTWMRHNKRRTFVSCALSHPTPDTPHHKTTNKLARISPNRPVSVVNKEDVYHTLHSSFPVGQWLQKSANVHYQQQPISHQAFGQGGIREWQEPVEGMAVGGSEGFHSHPSKAANCLEGTNGGAIKMLSCLFKATIQYNVTLIKEQLH